MTIKNHSPWLSRIRSREEARTTLRECTIALLFLAALQAVFAYFHGASLLVGAIVWAIGGGCLLRWHSRAVAMILLLCALAGTGVMIANNAGAHLGGGKNIALALIILWTSLKAVEASFRLHGRFALDLPVAAVGDENQVQENRT